MFFLQLDNNYSQDGTKKMNFKNSQVIKNNNSKEPALENYLFFYLKVFYYNKYNNNLTRINEF